MKKKAESKDSPKTKASGERPKSKKDFLVVGLGASAGGVKALQEFFATMPPDSGMAFVVILHLSPEHESSLPHILQAQTKMKVTQVTKTIKVEPNNVYVIPPNQQLEMVDGIIRPKTAERPTGHRIAIDVFFRTLAEAYQRNAVCVVLSGTGSDGTLGLKRIKESNGFAIVQDPEDAEYDSMPRAAINTQLADWILPVHQMPEKLIHFKESSERLHLTNGADAKKVAEEIHADESLREILTLLRVRTGHDFSNYKTPTLVRRIARHLQIHELEDIPSYLELLRNHPNEIQSLLKNLLINVTNFFRDKDAFEALESEIVPNLFAGKTGKDTVRAWSAGCASGEEAFSLAIILTEYADKLSDPPKINVFASDVDDEAIAEAREHRYPESIEADVSPERLKRFFMKEGSFYRVKKELRETVLFAPHNVLRDPPFSRLDLIACRNLLIYLNRETQERVLQIFHFALNSSGYLFLGSSETAENVATMYSPVNKKHRIYSRRNAPAAQNTLPVMPVIGRWEVRMPERKNESARDRAMTLSDIHYRLLENYAPSSALVNQDFDIVYLSGTASRFLRFTGGEPSRNLLKAIVPDLLPDLRAALFTAQREHKSSEFPNIRVRINGEDTTINLIVRTVEAEDEASDFLLVIFEEKNSPAVQRETDREIKKIADKDEAMETVVRRLEEDLQRTKEHLRSTIEQHETTVEELKASNEELQAINEELRSASEELETSKEELQSVNEELTTVNHELKDKIDETSRINSDLQNLMAATDIATIFLDKNLKIKRFTPPVERIFNITLNDVGRPLEHFTHKLRYENLSADAEKALRSLTTIEREITDDKKRSYLSRFAPYRTIDDRIDGVVLNFIDITERKESEQELNRTSRLLQATFDSSIEEIQLFKAVRDQRGDIIDFEWLMTNKMWNDHWGEMTGKRLLKKNPGVIEAGLFDIFKSVTETGVSVAQEQFYDHEQFNGWYWLSASKVEDGFLLSTFDITERKQREQQQDFRLKLSDTLRPLSDANEIEIAACRILGEQLKAHRVYYVEIFEPEGTARVRKQYLRGDASSIAGEYTIEAFDWTAAPLRRGEAVVVSDVYHSDLVPPEYVPAMEAVQQMSIVLVPLIKEGVWVGVLTVGDDAPRDWKETEVEQARETLERMWAAAERARAEEELRDSERLFRLVSDAVPSVIYDWNVPEDKITRSHELEHLLGFSPDDSITQTNEWWKTRLHPDDAKTAVEKVVKKLKSKDYRFEDEYRLQHRDGHYVWISDTGVLLRDEKGKVIRWIGNATDISQRKEAEEQLAKSVEHFRAIVDQNLAGIFEIDLNGKIIFSNDEFCRMLGYECGTLAELPMDKYIHTEDLTESAKKLERMQKNKKAFDMEKRFVRKDGSVIWVHNSISPITNGDKRIHSAVIVSVDITERKKADAQLREAEERTRITLEAAKLATWEWNLETNEVLWNEQHFRLFGMKPSKKPMTPDDFYRHVHPDHRDHVAAALKKSVEKKSPFDVEFCAVLENGKTRWMSGYGRVTETDAKGKTVKMSGVMSDITDRKAAAETLRKNEEQLQLILESTKDYAIVTFDLEGFITRWNTGAEKIFGWTESEMIGKKGDILFTPEDRAAKVPAKEFETARKKGRAEDERWHIRKDGSRFFASGVMQLLKDGEVEGFVKIARDQTERLRAETILRDQEMLRQFVRTQEDERQRIAREIHDQLGQQLTVLRFKIDGLKKMCAKMDIPNKENAAAQIEELQKTSEQLDRDVDFLAWELRPSSLEDLGLRLTLQNFVKEWSNYAGVKSDFHTTGMGKVQLTDEIETNIYRIAQEALNNISKHARATNVSVLLERRKDTLVLIIEDDGIGFNVNAKPKGAKGLGLVGMRERTNIIGGEFEIESQKGTGTTVFVRVPIRK